QPRSLQSRHQLHTVRFQPQGLNLVQQALLGHVPLKLRPFLHEAILKVLALDEPALADGTNGQALGASKAVAATAAEPAGTELATADAMDATPAGVADVALAAQLRNLAHRPMAARAPQRRALGC